MNNKIIDNSDEQQILSAIKEIDQSLMSCLNARLRFAEMLVAVRGQSGHKRNFKEEQEMISAASETEWYPGTAYAIWPTLFDFIRSISSN